MPDLKRKKNKRPDRFSEIGIKGRKTGLVVQGSIETDSEGFEDIDEFYSKAAVIQEERRKSEIEAEKISAFALLAQQHNSPQNKNIFDKSISPESKVVNDQPQISSHNKHTQETIIQSNNSLDDNQTCSGIQKNDNPTLISSAFVKTDLATKNSATTLSLFRADSLSKEKGRTQSAEKRQVKKNKKNRASRRVTVAELNHVSPVSTIKSITPPPANAKTQNLHTNDTHSSQISLNQDIDPLESPLRDTRYENENDPTLPVFSIPLGQPGSNISVSISTLETNSISEDETTKKLDSPKSEVPKKSSFLSSWSLTQNLIESYKSPVGRVVPNSSLLKSPTSDLSDGGLSSTPACLLPDIINTPQTRSSLEDDFSTPTNNKNNTNVSLAPTPTPSKSDISKFEAGVPNTSRPGNDSLLNDISSGTNVSDDDPSHTFLEKPVHSETTQQPETFGSNSNSTKVQKSVLPNQTANIDKEIINEVTTDQEDQEFNYDYEVEHEVEEEDQTDLLSESKDGKVTVNTGNKDIDKNQEHENDVQDNSNGDFRLEENANFQGDSGSENEDMDGDHQEPVEFSSMQLCSSDELNKTNNTKLKEDPEPISPKPETTKRPRKKVAGKSNTAPKLGEFDENENSDGIRRSQRTRMKPLEFWRNERITYALEKTNAGSYVPTIKEVIRAPKSDSKPKRKKRTRLTMPKPKRLTRKEIKGGLSDGDSDLGYSSDYNDDDIDTEKVKQNAREKPDYLLERELEQNPFEAIANVIDFHSKLPVKRTVAVSASAARKRLKAITVPESEGTAFSSASIFADMSRNGQSFLKSGLIEIPPGSSKPLRSTKDFSFVFFVSHGAVEVGIHNVTIELESGSHFCVPRGNFYSISNLGPATARLFYASSQNSS